MVMNMYLSLTEKQIRNRTKTVVRSMGWEFLMPGDELQAVRKPIDLKKEDKVEFLARLRVVSVRREPLSQVTHEDIRKEGFPGMMPGDFVNMFMDHMALYSPSTKITRIEFEYLD